MPDLTSAALFERDDKVLVAHRRRSPFAGQWILPIVIVRDDEAAEDALRRHVTDQFGVGLGGSSFVETVYITDRVDSAQYVANIFRIPIGGPMRFNAEGEYDDARWLGAGDLEQLWMPPDLRVPLIKILTDPDALHDTDWNRVGDELAAQGVPLAEREGYAPPLHRKSDEAAPDNRAAWDAIAEAYDKTQANRDPSRLRWANGTFEDELHVLAEVRGKRALVAGCGSGRDAIALAALGAIAVGIDSSPKQIQLARGLAAKNDAINVSFTEADAADLSRFDDESFDLAVSIDTLQYVEDTGAALTEAARVVKPGGVLAIAVPHPFADAVSAGAPYYIDAPYWRTHEDWSWNLEGAPEHTLRSWMRPVSEWFDALTAAGFAVERIVEPYQGNLAGDEALGFDIQRAKKVPLVLIIKARKR